MTAKARLIEAIHTVEDIFINYSRDTIQRIVDDFRAQQQAQLEASTSLKKTSTAEAQNDQTGSIFSLRHEWGSSANILLNDIQKYADRVSTFRQMNAEYFDV